MKTNNDDSATARRSELILQELLLKGEVTVDNLANRLKVSSATIRRDLTILEHRGLLRRSHGGAIPVEPSLYEPFLHVSSFSEQEQQRTAEKRRIGLAAAELIRDGETIAFGAGTTTTQIARSIRHRRNLTVLTNAINIAMELSHRNDLKIFVTGGELSGAWFALVGATAQQQASEMFIDKAFIGVDGIHAELGLTTNYPDQAAIHRTLLQQARQRIVVADHRKIGNAATSLIWRAHDIDIFITDKKATMKAITPFTDKGIEVIRA
ncbi:MAG: DeoR/GlpR family DNA-binding transcription regulator [Pyrinomonadaceae bacterium]